MMNVKTTTTTVNKSSPLNVKEAMVSRPLIPLETQIVSLRSSSPKKDPKHKVSRSCRSLTEFPCSHDYQEVEKIPVRKDAKPGNKPI